MSEYLQVAVEDLNIDDFVRGEGKVVYDVVDHDKLRGFVVVVFSLRGEENIRIYKQGTVLKVKYDED